MRRRFDADPSEKNSIALEQSFGIYDRVRAPIPEAITIARTSIAGGALEKRKQHADLLRQEFSKKDVYDLWGEDVTPWVVPLFFGKTEAERAVDALTRHGVETGLFRFDVKRNMLDPEYKACVAIPCHDGINEKQMEGIVSIIRKQL